MTDLYKNKYRIPSARLQTYNYASQGMYFVTICTKFMQHYFGKIITDSKTNKARLDPTEIGKIAESEWYKCLELRPDMNLDIGEFIVMPNHIHGIILIGKNEYNSGGNIGELNRNSELNGNAELNGNSESNRNPESHCGSSTDAMHRVSTQSKTLSHHNPKTWPRSFGATNRR
jgi:REP element-mobilizing transposase RayT